MRKRVFSLMVALLMFVLVKKSFALAKVELQYEYNEKENKVIARIISDTELKDTKPTWELSQDKKTYTKIFTENMEYSTPVQDKDGNIIDVDIKITQVKIAQLEMEYEYNEEDNTVTVKIISDIELKDTKPTWKLSDDKKSYTKIYKANENYSTIVVDKYGNSISVEIKVTQIKVAQLKMEYQYNNKTNTVIAKIISDIELQDTKPTWELSIDKKIYTKIFNQNQEYNTPVIDKGGNIINVNIEIKGIDDKPPEIKTEYQYNEDDTVTIILKSNEKLGNTKPTWKLSDDGLTYRKDYDSNQNYTTEVQDIYGNSVTVPVILKKKKEEFSQSDGSKVKVIYMYTSYNNVIVQIKSTVEMEDTKPTWELSEDKLTYTKIYNEDTNYVTVVQDKNGIQKNVRIEINYFLKIISENGTYGKSGAKIKGVSGGSDLEYYRFGNGDNVLFATFCLHGYEDGWDRDGTVLVEIANNFYNKLVKEQDNDLAKDWTIYICKEVNPDGRRLGTTNNGAGRTTLYSKKSKGIDLNRCWQTGSDYKIYTNARNYNGTAGFQAYEAEYLRDFLLANKSTNGKTILVDLHGWLEQLIGDEEVCKYYKQQYTTSKTSYGRYGTQYLITWARQNLNAKVALVELPAVNSYAEVSSLKLSDKYINATLEMLKNE